MSSADEQNTSESQPLVATFTVETSESSADSAEQALQMANGI